MKKITFFVLLIFTVLANANTPKEKWYLQRTISADFSFSVLVELADGPGAESEDYRRVRVKAVRIMQRRTGDIFQEIDNIDGMETFSQPDDMVQVFDADVDGYIDFSVPFASGGAGPNNADHFYIFNPVHRRFELNQKLSELSQPGIGPAGEISSAWRDGCCHHHSETFSFRNGKLRLISEWDQSITSDGKWLDTHTSKLIKGRWHSKSSRQAASGPD